VARQAKGHERRELVIEAAAQAISDLGVTNVRVQDIAERANMTTGHVSYYFPSKNDLLLLAIRRSEDALMQRTREALEAIEDPDARLDELVALASAKQPRDEGWILWLQVWASGFTDEGVTHEHQLLDQRWFDMLVEVLEYGRAAGRFHMASVADTAEVVSGLIDGLSIQLTVGSGRLNRERLLALCARTCEQLVHP
jgi:AcrR family transcriptional regulator